MCPYHNNFLLFPVRMSSFNGSNVWWSLTLRYLWRRRGWLECFYSILFLTNWLLVLIPLLKSINHRCKGGLRRSMHMAIWSLIQGRFFFSKWFSFCNSYQVCTAFEIIPIQEPSRDDNTTILINEPKSDKFDRFFSIWINAPVCFTIFFLVARFFRYNICLSFYIVDRIVKYFHE